MSVKLQITLFVAGFIGSSFLGRKIADWHYRLNPTTEQPLEIIYGIGLPALYCFILMWIDLL